MPGHYDYPDTSRAGILPITEQELADRRVKEGRKVLRAHGRFWLEVAPGLYDGLHFLSRLDRAEAVKPRTLCWGYRTALTERDAGQANGFIPLHLVQDIEHFDLSSVPSKKTRQHLRSYGNEGNRIAHINRMEILEDQGYELYVSWLARTGHRSPPTRSHYLHRHRVFVEDPSWLVLGGMRGDTLLGYLTVWAVGQSAYLNELVVHSEYMEARVSEALVFESTQVLKRTGLIQEATSGLHMPEKEGLTTFKNRQGFALTQLPSLYWMHPLPRAYLARRHPLKHYRFTGSGPV